jgi:hypothetical protein
MLPVMDTVPFYFDSVHGGFSSCAGILHFNGENLRCEYRVDVGGLGLKTASKEASVQLDEIESIEFKRGWFRAKAVIRPKSLKLLDRFPASGDDSICLYFRRKDRKLAEYLISECRLKLSQSRLDF